MDFFVTFEKPQKVELREFSEGNPIFIDSETGEELRCERVFPETMERIQRGEEPEFPGLIVPYSVDNITTYWHVYKVVHRGRK
jgi:hypothetical protein